MTATAHRAAHIADGPLADLDEWDDHVAERYPTAEHTFRDYDAETRPSVKEFYRLNHENQTYAFAAGKKAEYGALDHAEMGVWEAMEFLDELVDDSDPDTDASQIEHLLQTSEAMRADDLPRWFQVTGMLHDLGKVLCLWGEPQWAVVGDTYPTGCAHSDRIVFSEFFAGNPDSSDPRYSSANGIYEPGCGFDNVTMSWGHDEYIYTVVGKYLPEPAQYMLRYHSFYPWHRDGAYAHLASDKDREMLPWIKRFNTYDLYTKVDVRPDPAKLKGYYSELIAEFFPPKLSW